MVRGGFAFVSAWGGIHNIHAGFISKEDTLAALNDAESGTFICRFSNSAPGKLAISYKGAVRAGPLRPTDALAANGKVSHVMVTVSADGFLIGNTSYASFMQILSQSTVFTTVAPNIPLAHFQEALLEAAGTGGDAGQNDYASSLE